VIRIVDAKFITSSTSRSNLLEEGISEVAFLGRSNVGKSSFINSLTNKKTLAKKSSTPGKTRLINFFEVIYKKDEESFTARFVDLPGFGYAKVSKSMQEEWSKHLNDFIKSRISIRTFVHLLDARHPNQKIDEGVREYLKSIKRDDQKIIEIFTKADKLNQKELSRLKRDFPNALMVSNLNKKGIEKANNAIFGTLFS
jgi:GTP-binding protein